MGLAACVHEQHSRPPEALLVLMQPLEGVFLPPAGKLKSIAQRHAARPEQQLVCWSQPPKPPARCGL